MHTHSPFRLQTTKIVAESKGNTSRHLSFISAIQEGTDYTDDNTNHILEYEGRTYLVGSQAKSYMEVDNSKNTELHKICVMTALFNNNTINVVDIGGLNVNAEGYYRSIKNK